MDGLERFLSQGWLSFPADQGLAAWARAARDPALAVAADPDQRAAWLRCGGTWFVGVHGLANDAAGAIGGVPLAGSAVSFATALVDEAFQWDRAQVSICYRGYPQPWEGESAAASRYRLRRDAAHVDGLHRGPAGERFLEEYHQFLLGVALNDPPPQAAPFVVWEGSHHVMRSLFADAFAGLAQSAWHRRDVAEVYQAARRQVFETCRRVELPLSAGAATVVHRHTLHGMAPWPAHVPGPDEGRVIAYFRPEADMGREKWLEMR